MARKKVHHKGAVLAGVGLLAAATVMGGRFLYGKSGPKHRKQLAVWAGDLKEDSIAILGDAKVISRKAYHSAVEMAAKKYKKLENIDAKDLERAVRDIKGRWREVSARFAKTKKVAKKVGRKIASR